MLRASRVCGAGSRTVTRNGHEHRCPFHGLFGRGDDDAAHRRAAPEPECPGLRRTRAAFESPAPSERYVTVFPDLDAELRLSVQRWVFDEETTAWPRPKRMCSKI